MEKRCVPGELLAFSPMAPGNKSRLTPFRRRLAPALRCSRGRGIGRAGGVIECSMQG